MWKRSSIFPILGASCFSSNEGKSTNPLNFSLSKLLKDASQDLKFWKGVQVTKLLSSCGG
jgi:hypothetical protein